MRLIKQTHYIQSTVIAQALLKAWPCKQNFLTELEPYPPLLYSTFKAILPMHACPVRVAIVNRLGSGCFTADSCSNPFY